jgi:hypothetical protein
MATFSVSLEWPLYTGLTVHSKYVKFQNSLQKKPYQNQMKNKGLCTNNRNIHFCTIGPLVWKRVGLQYQPLFSVKDQKSEGCQLQLKLLHENHFLY